MRRARTILVACLLTAHGCAPSRSRPDAPTLPQAPAVVPAQDHGLVAHFIEIETDSGAVVAMSRSAERAPISWRAADGRGEVSEREASGGMAGCWTAVFRVEAMPAGREAFLHLPLHTREGLAVDIEVNGAPLQPGFCAVDSRILLGRDEATRIAVCLRAH